MIAWAFLAAALALLAVGLRRGLDLTDEAYYVAWISQPEKYEAIIHPFGLFFHAISWNLTPSLIFARLSGIALLVTAGALLGVFSYRYYTSLRIQNIDLSIVPLSMLFALSYYCIGNRTPGYNLLADAAAATLAAGIFGWFTRSSRQSRDDAASILVGLGGCMAFLGKPTLAVIAAAVVGALLATDWIAGRKPVFRRALIVAAACFLPLLIILLSTVTLRHFIDSVLAGIPVLNFNNSLPRLLHRAPRELYAAPAFLAAAATAALFTAALLAKGERAGAAGPWLGRLNLGVLCLALISVPLELAAGVAVGAPATFIGPPVIAVALALAAFGAARSPGMRTGTPATIPIGLLLCLPFAIGFGSANGWLQQTSLSLHPSLLALAIAARLYFSGLIVRIMDAIVCTAVIALLILANFFPYRLPTTMFEQNLPVRLPFTNDSLFVDAGTRDFVMALASISRREGVSPSTPIMDLSNQGPGTVLILNGRAPWFPWLNANYSNAVPLANAAWRSLPRAEQRRAWFIGPVDGAVVESEPARHLRLYSGGYEVAGRLRHPLSRKPLILWRPATSRPPAPAGGR